LVILLTKVYYKFKVTNLIGTSVSNQGYQRSFIVMFCEGARRT